MLTPVLERLGAAAVQTFKRSPELFETLFSQLGEITGLGASRAKLLGVEAEIQTATEVRVSGKLIAITPEPKSITIAKAAGWFRQRMTAMASEINNQLSLEAQVKQAYDMRKDWIGGATAALYDKNLRGAFRGAFDLEPLEEIYARLAKSVPQGLKGDALEEAVLKEITTLKSKRFAFESEPGCFAKGTLVHTKDGLVPIEKIKVGDLVLSKPEGGGELEYKRVTRTFVHEPSVVMMLAYRFKNDGTRFNFVYTTPNHPFWVSSSGWTEAGRLNTWPGKESPLELMDGQQMISVGRKWIFRTSIPNVGWISRSGSDIYEVGDEWDYEKCIWHRIEVYAEDEIRENQYPEFLEIPVYNIEVADFQTYFVGEEGIWVHNKSPDATIQVLNGGTESPSSIPTFFSETELLRYITDKIVLTAMSS